MPRSGGSHRTPCIPRVTGEVSQLAASYTHEQQRLQRPHTRLRPALTRATETAEAPHPPTTCAHTSKQTAEAPHPPTTCAHTSNRDWRGPTPAYDLRSHKQTDCRGPTPAYNLRSHEQQRLWRPHTRLQPALTRATETVGAPHLAAGCRSPSGTWPRCGPVAPGTR